VTRTRNLKVRSLALYPIELQARASSVPYFIEKFNDLRYHEAMNPERDSKSMFYTYVLMNKNSRFYTGFTYDLRKRFNEHNDKKSTYTKYQGSYALIYYEACRNENDVRRREKYLKSGTGKRYLKSRLKRFLSRTG
jgi:putative endonuclease